MEGRVGVGGWRWRQWFSLFAAPGPIRHRGEGEMSIEFFLFETMSIEFLPFEMMSIEFLLFEMMSIGFIQCSETLLGIYLSKLT